MDRAAFDVVRGVKSTQRTQDSTFTITSMDVGSNAVRPGCMAEIEEELQALLVACKVALNRLQDRGKPDALVEFALTSAIRMAEIGKPG